MPWIGSFGSFGVCDLTYMLEMLYGQQTKGHARQTEQAAKQERLQLKKKN
jgi:transcriptional antiterminator Rof (Rho-off)